MILVGCVQVITQPGDVAVEHSGSSLRNSYFIYEMHDNMLYKIIYEMHDNMLIRRPVCQTEVQRDLDEGQTSFSSEGKQYEQGFCTNNPTLVGSWVISSGKQSPRETPANKPRDSEPTIELQQVMPGRARVLQNFFK